MWKHIRPGQLIRDCDPTSTKTTDTCPGVQKRIWADGIYPANDSQNERDNFLKYKEALRAYFLSAIQRGLELEEMREDEAALGEIYDRNITTLDENKPGWITPEQEKRLRAVSREAFVSNGKETLAENYKVRALRGLELIRSLPSK